jgi:Plants and Prokaryotes Conserved (PCC) domain
MQRKLLHRANGQRTYTVVLETGDEVMQCLSQFVAAENVSVAQLTAIGALKDVTLLYFDWEKRAICASASWNRSRSLRSSATSPKGPMASPRFMFTLSSASRTAQPWRVTSPRRMCDRRSK